MNSVILFDKISKISLYLLVFFLPLWFLAFTQNVVDYQKQVLLVVLVLLSAVTWLAKMVYKGEVTFRGSWLHIPVLLLLGMVGLSTIFSAWRYGSFWGWPLDVTDNFLTIFAFVVLYFLITQTIENVKHLFFVLFILSVSGTIAVVFAFLQLKGIHLLPFSFAQANAFNTLGTPNGVAIFAAVLLPLVLMLASAFRSIVRWALWPMAAALFASIAFIDFFDAWITLMGGMVVILAFQMWNVRKSAKLGGVSLPALLLIISLFFVILGNFSLPGAPVIQPEVSPNYQGEFDLLKGVAGEGPLAIAVGSGPGTFSFDYAKYHSSAVNQTIFWGTRFASGAAEIFDWFLTKGALGLLSLLGLMGTAVYLTVRHLARPQEDAEALTEEFEDNGEKAVAGKDLFVASRNGDSGSASWAIALGLLASFAAIVVAQFLYPANLTLWFVFWVVLGSLGFVVAKQVRHISLAPPSVLALGFSFALLLVAVFGVGLLFIGGQKYAAEIHYLKGAQASRLGDVEKAIAEIQAAANANPSVDYYWRDLSQLYLTRANQVSANEALATDIRQQQAGVSVRSAINSAQQATRTAPANVANWNVQGFVYRSLIGISGAERFSITSYEKAIELEPASPFPWTELGRVYVLKAQRLAPTGPSGLATDANTEVQREEALANAVENLTKAIALKDDYAPAHYLIAVAFDQQGRSAEAVAQLEAARANAPNDIGLAFQLGVTYWQNGEFSKAEGEFERARRLNPGYANARYMLGLVYDRLGQVENAKAEFAAVLALNPANQEVKDILANLVAGRPALQGLGAIGQPPIADTPPEIFEEPVLESEE